MPRLLARDLKIIGVFLYGTRWQTALARALQRSDRLVRYWAAGDRPLSPAASASIEALVRNKHGEQMRRTRAYYLDMIATLSDSQIKGRLLTMDLGALRLDDQLRQQTLIETDLVLALVAESRADIERVAVVELGSLCSVTYCALRAAVAPQRQRQRQRRAGSPKGLPQAKAGVEHLGPHGPLGTATPGAGPQVPPLPPGAGQG